MQMMKRYLLPLTGMFMLASMAIAGQVTAQQLAAETQSAGLSKLVADQPQLTAGKQYTRLSKPVADQPEVLEFFSFYCPHCYEFEQVYRVSDEVRKNLPQGVKFTKYHAVFMGPLGEDLTKAWAVAISLGVEDKVVKPLFEGIQKTDSIKTAADIRKVFVQAAGMTDKEYDAALNSFMVNALVLKQKKAAIDLQLSGVPAFYVKGTYHINNGGLNVKDANEYGKVFSKTINELLKIK